MNSIDQWCSRRGITADSIAQHPHSKDLILLLAMRDSLWTQMNPSEQAVWGAYWGKVYTHGYPLHNKALTQLAEITNNTIAN